VHWALTAEAHDVPVASAELRHVSQASPLALTLPVAQYSVAHCVAQGPPEAQMQPWMIVT